MQKQTNRQRRFSVLLGLVEWRKLDHSIVVAVSGVSVTLLVSGLMVDMLSTFCSVFVV